MAAVSRPIAITIVSLLAGLMALAGIVFGALGIAGGAGAYGVTALVVGVIYFICAYGLWSLQGWAWMLSVIAQLLNIVSALVPLASKGSVVWAQLIVAVVILLYLNSGGVKRAFGR